MGEYLGLGAEIAIGLVSFVGSILGTYMAMNTRLALVEAKANDAKAMAIELARSLDRHVEIYHANGNGNHHG